MSDPLISVIVPVYNVERYLHRCLDSIISQTYRNLEIILVDDGSTDKSPKICDEYCAKDGRIKVIHKENSGAASARNAGLDIAKGDYIAFVDGDDFIDVSMYQQLCDSIQSNGTDMSVCAIKVIDDKDRDITNFDDIKLSGLNVISGVEALGQLCKGTGTWISPCNKLYKKTLFDDIRFPVGNLHEDWFLLPHILRKCNTISCLNEFLYMYYQRQGSTRHNAKIVFQRAIDSFRCDCDRLELLLSNNLEDMVDSCQWFLYMDLMSAYKQSPNDKHSRKILKKEYNNYCNIVKGLTKKGIRTMFRHRALLFVTSRFPGLFLLMFKTYKKFL